MSEWCVIEVNKANSIQGCIKSIVATQIREFSPALTQHWCSHVWTSLSVCGAPHVKEWGGIGKIPEEICQDGI